MKPFGCPVTILKTLDHLGKFEGKVDEGFLVGYYVNITIGNQTNNDAGIEINANAGKAKQEKQEIKLIMMQSSDDKDAGDVRDKGDKCVSKGSGIDDQEKTDSSTQNVGITEPSINTTSTNIDIGSLNINTVGPNDPSMPSLEETIIFDDVYDDREVGAEADTNNLELSTVVSPIPTTRVHKDHPKKQIIGDLNLANQTRRMLNFSKENARVSYINNQRRINHKDYHANVLWIQNQMLDYRFNLMNTKIYIDNESTICIVKKLVFHSKTKHLEIRHHFIRDSYKKKLIQVIKIHTDYNVADLLTKAFDVGRFNFLVGSIRLLNL
nr:putative ribonuclease H-like domain-containing protein [Tanacetum cinerariifolium]